MAAGTAPSPSNWSGLVDTLVLANYLDLRWNGTKRVRVLMDKLFSGGAVQMDPEGGRYLDWLIKAGQYDLNYSADLASRTWNRENHALTATAPYTFLERGTVLSENDATFLTTKAARLKKVQQMTDDLVEDIGRAFNKKLLQENGGADSTFGLSAYAGSQKPLLGLPSIFGYGTAAAYNPDTQTVGSGVAATDREVAPNATYCSFSTHPTNAISGVTNRVNEATSPVIGNWSSTAWRTGAFTTWAGNCLEAIEHIVTRQSRDNAADFRPNLGIMSQAKFRQFREAVRTRSEQHIVLTANAQSPDMGLYPKRISIPFADMEWFYDQDCPADVVYSLNTNRNAVMLKHLDASVAGQLDGPFATGKKKSMWSVRQFADINEGAFKLLAKCATQIIWRPDLQAALYPFA